MLGKIRFIGSSVLIVLALMVLSFSSSFAQNTNSEQPQTERPTRYGGVLYAQTDNAVDDGVATQTFEAAYQQYDSETADDFVVTGTGWIVDGFSFSHIGPNSGITALRITIYSDNAGMPDTAVCSPTATFTAVSLFLVEADLSPACVLSPGTYWVGLSVVQSAATGQIYWQGRTPATGSEAVWRNPNNGFGRNCFTWSYVNTVCGAATIRDMLFTLYGTTPISLSSSAVCSGDDLVVTIADGNTPFTISGTGPGLPLSAVGTGNHPLSGPAAWTGVTVTEDGGDNESIVLGDFACAAPSSSLNASAVCSGDDLVVSILTGNAPFSISGTGPGLPLAAVGTGNHTLTGPATWTGVTITEDAGDLESIVVGDFDCEATITPVVEPAFTVPNLGVVAIGVGSPVQPYGAPGKELQSFMLPHDSDGNGFDTYTVTATVQVEGETWVALFNGTGNWLWVPYDAVQEIVPVRGLN